MMKQYKKELIVSTLLALLPIAAGLLLWNRLPGQLATHWGMHGADRWSGKAAAVFLQPLLLLAAHYLVLFLVFRDAKNRNQSKKVVGLLFWIMPATSILVSGITYAVALGWKFRLAGLLYVGLGLMFAAIGNYFPKCRPNRTVGIRIIWTLGSEENWNATHRFAGKVWVIGGLIMVLALCFRRCRGSSSPFSPRPLCPSFPSPILTATIGSTERKVNPTRCPRKSPLAC